MIPRSLVIEGLYSYRKKTTIDFSDLTAARLFGIFGPVGSGKSTLIEAMSLAVYGDTTRLNSRGDNRTYNILNLRSKRLWIDFVFSHGGDETYRFTAEAQRKGSDFENVGPLARSAYRLVGDEWIPLGHVSGEQILGLSYENFRRTVIIPQGHFQEFLRLGIAERTKMLKELFALDRFDLYRRAKTLYDEARTAVEKIGARLDEIPGDLQETIDRIEGEITAYHRRRKQEVDTRDELARRRERLQSAADLSREAKRLGARYDELEKQKESITVLRQHLVRLETTRDRVMIPFRERESAQMALGEAAARVRETEQAVAPVRESREHAERHLAELKQRLEKRPETEARRTALQTRLEIAGVVRQRDTIDRGLSLSATKLAESETLLRQLTDRYTQAIAKRNELTDGLPDPDTLRKMDDLVRANAELAEVQTQLDTINDNLVEIESRWCARLGLDATVPSDRSVAERIDTLRAALARARSVADRHHHLEFLAASLSPGEPCPLCGATDHPQPFDDSIAHTDGDGAAPLPADELIGDLERIRAQAEHALARRRVIEERLSENGTEGAVTAAQVAGYWRRHEQVGEIDKTISTVQREREACQARVAENRTGRAGEEARRAVLSDRIDELHATATPGDLSEADTVGTEEDLAREISRIDEERTTLDATVEQAETTLRGLQRDEDRLVATMTERTETLSRATAARDDAAERLTAVLGDAIGIVEEELPGLIGEVPRIGEHHETVSSFEREYREVSRDLKRLRDKLNEESSGVDSGNVEADLAEVLSCIQDADKRIQEIDTAVGELQNRTADAKQDLERRKQLEAERTRASNRRDDLATLVNLFKGSGFVSYVAQVYLEQLVTAANERFRRLTRNRLTLALRDGQEFEVIDYLNGGHRRSVKTLSGGQTFQAALCLALALVDSVDRSARSDEPGFFFLDEGFGSLDEESLRDVFSTLNDLRNENRIVGVISHVESLKQEIETYLRIEADEESGSVVR